MSNGCWSCSRRWTQWFANPAIAPCDPAPTSCWGRGRISFPRRWGPLDLLGALHDGRGYDELLPFTEVLRDGTLEIRVLDLNALIEVKAEAGRAKDKLLLPILLALRNRKAGR